jgi:hypothetical protein
MAAAFRFFGERAVVNVEKSDRKRALTRKRP